MSTRMIHGISVLFGLVVLAQMVFAGGTEFKPVVGARTLGRNGLYIAGIDGVTAAVANPSGLVYLAGRGLELSVFDRYEQHEYNSQNLGLFRSFRENDWSFAGGAYWVLTPSLAVAVTYSRVADFHVTWPFALARTKGATSDLKTIDMFNRIRIDAFSPSLAIRVGGLAVAVTTSAYQIRHQMGFPLTNEAWYQNIGSSVYQMEYEQDAWAYGFGVGIMLPLSENLRAGGILRSAYSATLKGAARCQMLADLDTAGTTPAKVNVSSDFEMPWALSAGLIYKLSQFSEVNLDIAYTLWGKTPERLNFVFENTNWQSRLSSVDTVTGLLPSSFPLSLNNSVDVGLGFEYSPQQGWTYRAGYRYSQSPNSVQTYSWLFPSVDQHWLSVGVGYKDGQYAIDASLACSLGVSKELSRTENPNALGTYDSNSVVPAVNLRYNF